MGRLNGVDTTLNKRLEPWVNNPPAYDTVIETYKQLGRTKALIVKLKRHIESIEDEVSIEIDKPRSNEAKKAKIAATKELKDELATHEADLEVIEADVKTLEFMKSMFSSSNYRMKLQEQYT